MKRAGTRSPARGHRPARVRALAGAGLVAVLATALAGCSTQSPSTITTPYQASDGVNVDLGGNVGLRNFLVVADAQGGRGAVVGAVVNQSAAPVTVELTAELGETTQPSVTRIRVPAGAQVLVAPGQRQTMVVPDIPAGPGQLLPMTAAAASAGATRFQAPVVSPNDEYASLTVAPTTATPSESPSSTEPAGGTGAGQSTATATTEPTGEPTTTP